MSIVETVLVFVGSPLAIMAVVALGVYGRGMTQQSGRYRPGRPWPYAPSWFVPHASPDAHPVSGAPALEAGQPAPAAATGGATGEW